MNINLVSLDLKNRLKMCGNNVENFFMINEAKLQKKLNKVRHDSNQEKDQVK